MIKGVISLCAAASLALSTAAMAAAPPADTRPVFIQMADEAAGKLLASPEYQARTTSGRKPRIVVGDIRNNTDDEGVRVEDIFNEIRNVVVASGTARLFSPGELNADLIISPELTSSSQVGPRGRRQRCVVLQLTTTTVSGEYFTAHSATRCN